MKSITNYITFILVLMAFGFLGCENSVESDDTIDDTEIAILGDDDNHDDSNDYTWEESSEVIITLADNSTNISGNGASLLGNIISISAAGTYNQSVSLNDGQIIVNTEDDEIVSHVFKIVPFS